MAYQYHHQDHAAAALGMDAAAAAAAAAGNPGGGGFAPGLGAGGWEREKAAIEAHPLYERLLEAHVACLRVATPVDQLPRIDAQIAARAPPPMPPAAAPAGGEELDLFMTHYVLLLCSFKEQLQQHVRVHAMEAVMACWELEQTLQSLTGSIAYSILSSSVQQQDMCFLSFLPRGFYNLYTTCLLIDSHGKYHTTMRGTAL
uniref:KNOX1 domain-containing protein n=1 Tax=Triticum urartu TaxID=4572 RepID=A0A8R7V9U7_TRIUA